MTPNEVFQDGNQIPDNFRSLEELWEWHEPLIEAEKNFMENNKNTVANNGYK